MEADLGWLLTVLVAHWLGYVLGLRGVAAACEVAHQAGWEGGRRVGQAVGERLVEMRLRAAERCDDFRARGQLHLLPRPFRSELSERVQHELRQRSPHPTHQPAHPPDDTEPPRAA